jgi:hypothetical protein
MKTLARPVLRLESRDSPGSASTGRTPSWEISKVVATRDANQLFWKSLLSKVGASEIMVENAKSLLCEGVLEGGSGVVVLVQYLALVDSHDPVESEDQE